MAKISEPVAAKPLVDGSTTNLHFHAAVTGLVIQEKLASQSMSGLTPVDITDLTIPLAVNEKLHFKAYLIMTTPSSTDGIRLAVNGPASPTQIVVTIVGWTSQTAIATTGINAYETFQNNTSSNDAAHRVYEVYGLIVNNGNAGTFALRMKGETAGAVVTCHAGSWIQYFKS